MIELKKYYEPVRDFLLAGIERFRSDHPKISSPHVALYCCPWTGWISLCLNGSVQKDQNCPDFEFVEFALFETSAARRSDAG